MFVRVCVISQHCSPSVLFPLIVSNEQIGRQLLSQPGLLQRSMKLGGDLRCFVTSRADEGGVFEVSVRAGADRRRTESGQGGNIWMDQRHGSEKQTGAKTKW